MESSADLSVGPRRLRLMQDVLQFAPSLARGVVHNVQRAEYKNLKIIHHGTGMESIRLYYSVTGEIGGQSRRQPQPVYAQETSSLYDDLQAEMRGGVEHYQEPYDEPMICTVKVEVVAYVVNLEAFGISRSGDADDFGRDREWANWRIVHVELETDLLQSQHSAPRFCHRSRWIPLMRNGGPLMLDEEPTISGRLLVLEEESEPDEKQYRLQLVPSHEMIDTARTPLAEFQFIDAADYAEALVHARRQLSLRRTLHRA